MHTRLSKLKWGALGVLMLGMSFSTIAVGGGRVYGPVNGYYYDVRDTRTYSDIGWHVPVTVPLAPMVRSYNYGWGVPSTRLSPVGNYTAWYPDVPYTFSGGRLHGDLYPTIYHPTDTTQLGAYHNYVPTWQPR